MSIEPVRNALQAHGLADRIIEFSVSSATVTLAAEAIGGNGTHIAKSLAFHGTENTVLPVAAGDARIDNGKFKAQFGCKAKMLSPEEVIAATGHAVGGVCPFALPEAGVEVSDARGWVDGCRGWNDTEASPLPFPAPVRTLRFFGGNHGHQRHRNQETAI